MKTIAIYSQEPVLAHGLISILPADFLSLGIFASVEELREQFLTSSPDLLVLDMDSPVDLETLRDLGVSSGGASTIIWVNTIPPAFASQCLAAGVRGVLPKSASLERHIRCLTEVAAGSIWMDPALVNSFRDTKQVRLSPREQQLMASLAEGMKNKEIAWSLGITEGTVKVYLSRLFTKVGAGDRLELALMALRNLSGVTEISVARKKQPVESPLAFPVRIHLNSTKPGAPAGTTGIGERERLCAKAPCGNIGALRPGILPDERMRGAF
jgi:DNA-binding NarL/FixJ family response regulator